MFWWGKLFGGLCGYLIGGVTGALIGALLGHLIDVRLRQAAPFEVRFGVRQRARGAFFQATFSVLGHLAKVDGRVTEDEIRMAQAVMDQFRLNRHQREIAKDLFRQGKQADFPLDRVLDQFKRACRRHPALLRIFVEILLRSAYADGHPPEPAERKILSHISARLELRRAEVERMEAQIAGARARHTGPGKDSGRNEPAGPRPRGELGRAYEILHLAYDASDADVKKAYRRLMKENHPDKLVAQGLPEEVMRLASQKTYEIRTAYERIRAARGF